jgi:hypothetical protein
MGGMARRALLWCWCTLVDAPDTLSLMLRAERVDGVDGVYGGGIWSRRRLHTIATNQRALFLILLPSRPRLLPLHTPPSPLVVYQDSTVLGLDMMPKHVSQLLTAHNTQHPRRLLHRPGCSNNTSMTYNIIKEL